ncbi:hypothetical protein [Actinophytocola sp.]|uniref:hypothetical protein n=1 Tax=Actinophytocola sp. TaxID=1872138 RepID=UPI003D6A09E1
MSAYPVTPERSAARRPGTLTAAIVVTVLTAIVSIVNGIMIATGGSDLIKDILVDSGLPAEALTDENLESAVVLAGYASLDDFESTFAMRGYLALAAGAALLVFALLIRRAATWARVLLTTFALLTMAFAGVIVADETTTSMAMLSFVTLLGAVLSIIFTWLPANGRHAKAAAPGRHAEATA